MVENSLCLCSSPRNDRSRRLPRWFCQELWFFFELPKWKSTETVAVKDTGYRSRKSPWSSLWMCRQSFMRREQKHGISSYPLQCPHNFDRCSKLKFKSIFISIIALILMVKINFWIEAHCTRLLSEFREYLILQFFLSLLLISCKSFKVLNGCFR